MVYHGDNRKLKGIIIAFMCLYVITSGFVFFEPSISEIFFCLSFVYLIFKMKFDIRMCFLLLFIMLFNALGVLVGVGQDWINIKYIAIDYYLFIVFFVFYSLLLAIPFEEFIHKFMKAWTAAGLINILTSFAALVTGIKSLGGINFVSYGIRFMGFFKDPNVLGPFLIVPFLYWLEVYMKNRNKDRKVILIVLLLILGIVFSFSRAAWLNTAIGGFYLVWILSKGKRKRFFLRLIPVLSGAVIVGIILIKSNVFFSGISFKAFLQTRFAMQAYDEKRFDNQRMVFSIIKINPMFGIGPGNYEMVTAYSTHSLYIRMLGEHGITGIIFLVLLIIPVLGGLYRKRNEYAFLISGFLGLLVNSFFIDSWHWRHFWILLSFGFFITMNSSSLHGAHQYKKE